MDFKSTSGLEKSVKKAFCAKEGCLTWAEFLDFFFLKETDPLARIGNDKEEWWSQIDQDGK